MDILIGFEGDDLIDGKGNNDVIFGEAGNDTFVITADSGMDTILDFSEGEDAIALSGELSFEDLSFSGEAINLNGETLVVLSGVDTQSLTSDSFKTIQV